MSSRLSSARVRLAAIGGVIAVVLAMGGVLAPGVSAASDPVGTPFGHLDSVVAVPGGVQVRGWAIDPDTTTPIYLWVTIDGAGQHLYGNQARPDVAAAYPAFGADHGFAATLSVAAGTHSVCVAASNVGPGVHKPLGCGSVSVVAVGTPFGNYENVRGVVGGVEVAGWTIDPDTTDPIYVWVTVDGVGRHLYANDARPDVAAAYPAFGANHGFSGTLSASGGTHTVCVTASNVGPGAHEPLGCRTVSVVAVGTPFGNYESARGVVGGVEVTGWTIDPDTNDPIYVWVTVDGVGRHLYANRARPDVAAAYPGSGADHGFSGSLPAWPGVHTVCVTASNVGPGAHRSLGCRSVTSPAVEVSAGHDLTVTMPTTIAAGRQVFHITSADTSIVTLLEPDDGYTVAQMIDDLSGSYATFEARTRYLGGTVVEEGSTGAFGQTLQSGTYWMVDFGSLWRINLFGWLTEDDVAVFTVTGQPDGSAWPGPDAVATAKADNSWSVPSTLPAKGMLLLDNPTTTQHRLLFDRVPDGSTAEDELAFLIEHESELEGAGGLPGPSTMDANVQLRWLYDFEPGVYIVWDWYGSPTRASVVTLT